MRIGELCVTYAFATELLSSRAWEQVSKRCRFVSSYRWCFDTIDGYAVTVLCENAGPMPAQFEKAKRILEAKGGQPAPTPAHVRMKLSARRTRAAVGGVTRQVVRTKDGIILGPRGESLGPRSRPQG